MGPTTSLALAAVESILQVIVIALFGFILARRGYMTPSQQKWLSLFNMKFFTPALLFTKMASIITPAKFLAFWPIPIFYIVFALVSFFIARVGSRIMGLDHRYRDFATASIMFSNTNSLPIAVMQSLAFSQAGKALFWTEHDNRDDVAARGISYIMFFAIFGNLIRWSYGFSLIKPKPSSISLSPPLNQQYRGDRIPARFPKPLPFVREGVLVDIETAAAASPPPPSFKRTLSRMDTDDYLGLMNENGDEGRGGWADVRPSSAPRLERGETLMEEEDEGDEDYEPPMFVPPDLPSADLHAFPALREDDQEKGFLGCLSTQRFTTPFKSAFEKITGILSPPLVAALFALFVGLIPPLQDLLFSPKKFFYLSFTRALEQCGAVAIPLILVCLGAQMNGLSVRSHSEPATQNHTTASSSSPSSSSSSSSPSSLSVRFIVITRTLLVPLIVIPLVLLFDELGGPISTIADDPVFMLSMIIVGCAPTAINLIQICQAKGAFEDEMSRVLFWSYAVVAVPLMTSVVLVALWIITNFRTK